MRVALACSTIPWRKGRGGEGRRVKGWKEGRRDGKQVRRNGSERRKCRHIFTWKKGLYLATGPLFFLAAAGIFTSSANKLLLLLGIIILCLRLPWHEKRTRIFFFFFLFHVDGERFPT